MSDSTIIYTKTDEAPALATYSLLPIIQSFASTANVPIELRDISLAQRILAEFKEELPENQKVSDDLAELGAMAKTAEANIIKLPNISASVPQMEEAIAELQAKGYKLPNYSEAEERYGKIKGSAVNPVLREGNSDRRAPKAVKEYAKANPHRMGEWNSGVQSHVATMSAGDFRSNEQSITLEKGTVVRIEHVNQEGTVTVLKDRLDLLEGEILDATVMSQSALVAFLKEQVQEAKEQGLLFSLHMKATMMKVSDPIIFGHAVKVFLAPLLETHRDLIESLEVNFNNGLGDLISKMESLSEDQKQELELALERCYEEGPGLAMVNSDLGITNLHVPSDVIIDASMPAMIRSSGAMWNKEGSLQDTKAVIPDSSYAAVYAETVQFCKEHGAFDPRTMGTVPNVGLMAQKAEEYGSHDKTFEISAAGAVRVVDEQGNTLIEHAVEAGDIWRACQTKDAPIKNWVELAVARARATEWPAIFWLDETRAHDAELIEKVGQYLALEDTDGLDLRILSPAEATKETLQRVKNGENTISVTGNVLRDYLTDLFPILEVGTSAKMLSIVPLMNGGGLFETGAGGSAPKHVQQFNAENHLRWDSLGEFLALVVSLEHLAQREQNTKAQVLADALDEASTQYLLENKAPSRKEGELDNRGTHYYLARFWAEALAEQNSDAELKTIFEPIAKQLVDAEEIILKELLEVQGQPVDLGGYYQPSEELAQKAMRPSQTLNQIIDAL